MKKILTCSLLAQCLALSQTSNNITNADPLSETPLYPIPEEMTFEEYEDMNRISQALLWSSIPLPGITLLCWRKRWRSAYSMLVWAD